MNINYFKDCMFDLLNDSDMLNLKDSVSNDTAGTFTVEADDGSKFIVICAELE